MDIDELKIYVTGTAILMTIVILILSCVEVENTNNLGNTQHQNVVYKEKIEETPCEHEIVISSEYNFFLDKYKTYSKCIKCGSRW